MTTFTSMNHARSVLRAISNQDHPKFIAAMNFIFQNTESNTERQRAKRWLMTGNGTFEGKSFAHIVRQKEVELELANEEN